MPEGHVDVIHAFVSLNHRAKFLACHVDVVHDFIEGSDSIAGVLHFELLADAASGLNGISCGYGVAEGVLADDADVGEHAAEGSGAVVAEIANEVTADFVFLKDRSFRADDLAGEGNLGALIEDDDGVHLDVVAQALGH